MDKKIATLVSQRERDAVMAPIDAAMTLPAQAFASDAWLALEIERIFMRRWTAVLFESAVPGPGDVHPFILFGMPLVAIRGEDRTLRMFHNICPYDGCPVVRKKSSGLKHLEVFYHGWRYDLAGRLIAAPYWDGNPECGPEGLGGRDGDLVEIASEVRFGVLFIDLGGKAEPVDDWLKPWVDEVSTHFAIDNLVPARDASGAPMIEERTVAANWKTYQENASINLLHEAFTHAIYQKSPEVPRVEDDGAQAFELYMQDCFIAFSHSRSDTDETYDKIALPSAGHDPEKQPALGYFSTLYPNLNVPLLDAMIKINIAIPVSPGETRLMHLRFYRPEALEAENFLAEEDAVQKVFDIIHAEDQVAIEAVQQARASPVWRQHYYAPFWDALHHRFNQLVMADIETE